MSGARPAAVVVRAATPEDAPAISALSQDVQAMHAHAHPEIFTPASDETFPATHVRELMAADAARFWVAEVDGAVAGYLLAVVQDHPENRWKRAVRVLSVEQMGVLPARRGLGVGAALIAAAESRARELGIREVRLSVWAFNEGARRFYDRLGYVVAQEHRVRLLD